MPELESTIPTFDAWLNLLRKKLPDLGYAKNLAFAASCCERSLPNYEAFVKEERRGNPKALTEAVELVWRLIAIGNPADFRSYLGSLLKAVEAGTPDTEYFKSPLTSAALDAANSVGEALDYALDRSIEHIVTIASLARDTVDVFIQRRDNLSYSDKSLEDKIAHDPLMIEELRKQQADIKTLESTQDLNPDFWAQFRQHATTEGRSNLGIAR